MAFTCGFAMRIREGSFGHAASTQGTRVHRRHMNAICLLVDSGRQLAGCVPRGKSSHSRGP